MTSVGARTAILMALFVLAFGACSSGPAVHTVYVQGEQDLNRNTRTKQSTPVNVRFFQIKDQKEFFGRGFDTLWRGDQESLGDQLLRADETPVVTVGSSQSFQIVEPADAAEGDVKFVGVVGLFNKNDPKVGPWRVAIPVAEIEKITLSFRGYQIVKEARQ